MIELYWNCRDELTTEDGLMYRGDLLLIPVGECSNIVKSLQESHIGVEGTLRHARNIIYWPGIRATAEELEPSETNELTEQTEPTEASSDELLQPVVPSTPVASEQDAASHPTRERCPPLWLQDYEC